MMKRDDPYQEMIVYRLMGGAGADVFNFGAFNPNNPLAQDPGAYVTPHHWSPQPAGPIQTRPPATTPAPAPSPTTTPAATPAPGSTQQDAGGDGSALLIGAAVIALLIFLSR